MCVEPTTMMMAVSVLSSGAKFLQGRQQAAVASQSAQLQGQIAARNAEVQARQYEYDAAVSRNNRTLAERMAADEIDVGREEESKHRIRIAAMLGNTRAVLASSGFDATAEDAPVLMADIREVGEQEALTIGRNARNRASAQQFRAANFGAEAAMAQQAAGLSRSEGAFAVQQGARNAKIARGNPLLELAATGAEVADKWHKYSDSKPAENVAAPPDMNLIWT